MAKEALKKGKVLIVTTIGGFLPQFEMNDVRILQEYGMEVHYASNLKNAIYQMDISSLTRQGIRCHSISIEKSPAKIFANYKAYKQLKKIIDEENITLVHCHNPTGGVLARMAACMSRKKPKVIYTAHGLHFYQGAPIRNWILFYPVERFLAGKTDCLITINSEDRLRAETFKLKPGGKVRQIHGVGADLERFRKRPELYEPMRRQLGIPEGAFHIVTAAELNDNKNQKTVIEAIASLHDPDIFYSICGKGPMMPQLKALIEEKGLQGRVRLLGYCNRMEDILQGADCFAFPSKREGLGMAAIEALACGVPVIAAKNRGTREYLIDGTNGFVCPATDSAAFAQAIRKLKNDKLLYAQLAANCRQSVLHFGIADTDMRMRKIYKAMITSQGE